MRKFLFQMSLVPVMFGILTGLYVQAASAAEVKTVCVKVVTQEVKKNGSSVIRISTMCEKGR